MSRRNPACGLIQVGSRGERPRSAFSVSRESSSRVREWRTSLIADLGGPDAVSTQQLALVEMALRTKLLVDSVDAYVLAMPSPVNRQKRCL